jgi:carbamoyltransferase
MPAPLILGISCHFHDAAAALVEGDTILAAIEEERFTRRKHDAEFPVEAIAYCMTQAPGGRRPDAVVVYEDPVLKLDRILASFADEYPGGGSDFRSALRSFVPKATTLPGLIEKALGPGLPMLSVRHHQAHAASAFFASPFDEAAILVIDGVGEWATCSIGSGSDKTLTLTREVRYPHSIGMLYSVFTSYCGFKVNSGEYKLMGLAPFGRARFADLFREHLIEVAADGSFKLDTSYFSFTVGQRMYTDKLVTLMGRPPRAEESRIDAFYADVAASIQEVTEELVLRLATEARRETGMRRLCMAGGVALNCVANGRLARAGIFDEIWVQPAASDAGGALGAALAVAMERSDEPRSRSRFGPQGGSYFGPGYADAEIATLLDELGLVAQHFVDPAERTRRVAASLAEGMVVGRFQGRTEFGPRSLGNRSILGDPRQADMQAKINLKIKFRESWRPFAPAVLAEQAGEIFDLVNHDPYMLFVANVRERLSVDLPADANGLDLIETVQQPRSNLPAITHVDYSARVQCVHRELNSGFWELLDAFRALTGCPVLVNTSFNVRGEPIVNTPSDAIRCFLATDIDVLDIGSSLVFKADNLRAAGEAQKLQGQYVLD